MRNSGRKKKADKKLIALLCCAVAVFLALSLLFNGLIGSGVEYKEYLPDSDNNIHELVISEIMSNNSGVYVDDENKASDYVELYNGTSKTINLKGYGF